MKINYYRYTYIYNNIIIIIDWCKILTQLLKQITVTVVNKNYTSLLKLILERVAFSV